LPPIELSKLASALRIHKYNDGDVLYSEGELTNRCILIEEGNAEILFSESSYNEVVKPLLEHGFADPVAAVDDLIGVHRPLRKVEPSETILPPPISVSSRAVSGRASFSLMSTVPEDSEAPLPSADSADVSGEKPDLNSPINGSSFSDLRAFLISKVSWATKLPSRWLSGGHVGSGCLLGIPILRGKAQMTDSWKWYTREDLLQRGKDIAEGAKAPCTIIARGPVKCAVFTAERFEAMFGPISSLATMCLISARTRSMSLSSSDKSAPHIKRFDASSFDFLGVLGKGAFGNVFLAECDEWEDRVEATSSRGGVMETELFVRGRRQVAVKMMSKWEVVDLGFTRHVCDERRIMAELSSMFVLKLYGTFQTPEMIALVTEALPSQDLWSLIYQVQKVQDTKGLSLSQARFYCACLCLAFAHIHENGIAYRDVKPENIMIDEAGYIRIIDFGFAKRVPFTKVNLKGEAKIHTKSFTLCGTPGKFFLQCLRLTDFIDCVRDTQSTWLRRSFSTLVTIRWWIYGL
jgi:CRP-like cAMP-binding protein